MLVVFLGQCADMLPYFTCKKITYMLEDICKHTKLVIAVGTATALGTLAVCRLVQRRTSPRRKCGTGPGPTGKGKWKLYHAHSFMSARCVWLLEGKL